MTDALLSDAERLLGRLEIHAVYMAGLIDSKELVRLQGLINQLAQERIRLEQLVRDRSASL